MKNWQIFLLGLIIFEGIADIFSKYFSLSNKIYLAFLAIFFYIIANISWLISMKYYSNLTLGGNIFSVSAALLATFIGVFLFGEIITTKQIIGIILGMVALILLIT